MLLHIFGIAILATERAGRYAASATVFFTGCTLAAITVRVEDEETMLAAHFKAQWAAHVEGRWRLIPFFW